jgi:uncharacterized protein (TIGR02611 family)
MTRDEADRADLAERFERAAMRAEFETGRHERTDQAARTNVVIRLARMTLGAVILLAGLVMLALPGPGWLAIAAGLAILSKDVAWADRLLRYVRRRIPGVPEDGRVPRSAILTSIALGAAAVAASVWWYTS